MERRDFISVHELNRSSSKRRPADGTPLLLGLLQADWRSFGRRRTAEV